jgi:hypothetical protein
MGFHVFRVNLRDIAKAILICFVFFVEFTLQITGNQGGEEVLGLSLVLIFD